MKHLIIAIAPLLFLSCAHKTVHEYCQENLDRYKDYDQCYAEVSANGANQNKTAKVAGAFFTGMGQGMQNASRSQTHCTTTGGAGMYNTNCN